MNITQQRWQSNAEWPAGKFLVSEITTDTHATKGQAEGVCRLLRIGGYGGMGLVFPIRVWVSQADEEGK